ncbi:hypothetical protein [Myxococcus sp. RHSTA-1-4]|uniref:hypothetical protein n=1 Tax=Myxococcus sp. RHSTA-1-4 TaxID=2874601 RepID=UPI001CBFA6C6|nr:hypothetical protein [Myxococcus sp. RHSTA-1-4]MBZ4418946.1 hypothetical protein [Myxococcus sp. RHSTA-1-4]
MAGLTLGAVHALEAAFPVEFRKKEAFERLAAELDERIAQTDAAESHTPSQEEAPAALGTASA